MATGASIILRKLNVKIPEEVSILGYDNIIYSELVSPSISTVATPIISIADTALNIILNKDSCNTFLNKKFVVTPYLIERESTSKKLLRKNTCGS
jgi:DNA-binding LacI/PurR family transcriptional regulator